MLKTIISAMVAGCLSLPLYAQIQPKENSPYSALGMGNFLEQNFAPAAAMGGQSATYVDDYHPNILNPASLGSLQATAYSVGLYGQYDKFELNNQQAEHWSGNIGYLSLAFPIFSPINTIVDRKKRDLTWGMSLTLQPYTSVGYDVKSLDTLAGVGAVTYNYKGDGQTYRVSWGNGMKYKNWAAGVNVGYMFGKLANTVSTRFTQVSNSYENFFSDDWSVSNINVNTGIQYSYYFKTIDDKGKKVNSDRRIVLGATANFNTRFQTTADRVFTRGSFPLAGGGYAVNDTILAQSATQQGGQLPLEYSVGAMYEHKNKYRLAANATVGNWSSYRNELRPDALLSTARFSLGGEWVPNANAFSDYFKRMRYRWGVFYESDPRQVSNAQLQRYALTFGFGLPIVLPRQQTSFIDLAFEVGRFGTNKFIEENYIRAIVGFTLNDNSWFFKRKFN